MTFGFYSFSEPLKPGLDFFTPDESKEISSIISITSSINVNFTLQIRSNIAVQSSVTAVAKRIVLASALLNVNGATLTLGQGIRRASIEISSNSSLTVSILKNAFATTQISANSNAIVSIKKTSFAASIISANSNVVVKAIELLLAASNTSSSSNVIVTALRLKMASSAISIQSNATVIAKEILFASTSISSVTSTTAIAQEILKAQVAINVTSNAITTIKKHSFAASIITPSATVTTIAKRIKFASSVININSNLIVVGKVVLMVAKINQLFNNLSITVQTLKFSNTAVVYNSTTTVDFSSIRSLLVLDGVPLTNQNRKLDVSAAPVFIENLNWQGDASRYYKNASANSAAKRTFNLQWSFIPNYENKTVDLRASRDFLNKKSKDGDVHTLTILKQDEAGTTPYTEENVDVLITNYSENLIRRDLIDNVYYFDCSMSLQEV